MDNKKNKKRILYWLNNRIKLKKEIPVITIDGLASSGKSSVSKLLSKRLKYFVLDSGILYRAIAYIKINEPNSFSSKSLLNRLSSFDLSTEVVMIF